MHDRESSGENERQATMAELKGLISSLGEHADQGSMSQEQSTRYQEILNEWSDISHPRHDAILAELDNFKDEVEVLLTEFEKRHGE